MKNTGAAMGDLEGWIHLVHRFFSRKESNSFCSTRDRVDFRRLRLRAQNELNSMIPLPVLWEDVEVFLCKHGFEFFGTVR